LNLHPYELLDDQLVSDVASVPLLAQRVVLEVTERSALGKVPNLSERLAALRESGCSIAIDDLGAGYSGLSSFVELEPDLVKLDMSLVRDADKSAMKQQLIGSLTAMCRNMGLSIVAEGIETREERDTVIALGCDLLQGYRFGRPSPSFLPPSW
jgi:EAL domain-containing protein (putative c-di-GMP-specific phosphodiesterase class I)